MAVTTTALTLATLFWGRGFKDAVAAQSGQEEVASGVDASEGPTSASSGCVEDEQADQDGRKKRKRD